MLKKKYIYIYIQKSTRKSWKSGERNSAETAPRTGDKRSRIGNTNTPGGVYNMVVSSNARFIRDAHARTPNSALIVNTWKVWFGHGDHVLQACISSQGKTRRNGGSVVVGREKRGWRERERERYGTSALQISRDICSVLMVVRFSGLKEFRSSWSLYESDLALCVCARTCVRAATKIADGRRYTERGVKNLARTGGIEKFS